MMTPLLLAVALASSTDVGPSPRPVLEPTLAELRAGFVAPPADARVMMRWWWFGPAVTRTGIERELRLMKEGGIGGVEVQPVYPLAPDDAASGLQNLPFLSEEFRDRLRFASEKSHELGLRFDLTLGSGWPFGGPSVSIGDAAGRLRVERVKVTSGARRVVVPALTSGETLIGSYLGRFDGSNLVPGSLRLLDSPKAGVLSLEGQSDAAAGSPSVTGPSGQSLEVVFFIASRTGMMVKRAAVGAEGYVLDHYSRGATDRYLGSVGERLLGALSGQPPYAVFCDSLEVFGSDWADDLFAEFEKRRGYDLKPRLPALAFDSEADAGRIRHDWGQTLTELLEERFMAPLAAWARDHGTRLRAQAYGVPPARLSTNALVDLPEGEGIQWKTLSATRWASSAAHIYDRPVTSSETWTWLHSPVFRATPLDLKAEADLHFLQGINQLVGHGWPYTAEGVDYPGWRFYASGVYDDKNPWWHVMPDLSLYLQRVSFVLRQGRPANDVAIYLSNADAWSSVRPGQAHLLDILRERLGTDVVARVLESGYGFDFFDDRALEQVGSVQRGKLTLGQNTYRMVLLPGVESIPPDTYRKIATLVDGGGLVVATRRLPETAPGLQAQAASRSEVKRLSERLFGGATHRGHFFASEGPELAAGLRRLLPPDVDFGGTSSDLAFVHRRTADADLYFLVNTSNGPRSVPLSLREPRRAGEWWDPVTGVLEPAELAAGPGAEVSTRLSLPPYGSRLLVLTDEARHRLAPSAVATVRRPSAETAAVASPATAIAHEPPAGATGTAAPGGVAARAMSASGAEAIDLTGGWRVSFGAGSPSVAMEPLRSWTDDEATRFFSGLATYEREVEVPASALGPGLGMRLELGEGRAIPVGGPRARFQAWFDAPVREAAVVYVNDRRVGAVWCPPYALDLSGFLREGRNQLSIVVGNLAVNHMAGRALPDYRLLNLRYGQRFEAQDMDRIEPVPSGLLGPIRLVSFAARGAAGKTRP